ncbi:hypothetical protein [Clostridium sp.]|uniref:hypothetical protein n=1 Tax=Clostridium sp. TaxID=1506 RepID=UPI002633452E|nr:hypothetical protein [Clostridium sp.]
MLKELEQRLNDYWKESEELGNEFYRFKVEKLCDENYIAIICLNDNDTLAWMLTIQVANDMAAMITNCISALYDEFINPNNRIVRAWKGYINRKVKSLNLAMSKNNTEKVNKINQDMVEQYKKMNDAKFKVSEFKIFINMFYYIKSEYEPMKEAM